MFITNTKSGDKNLAKRLGELVKCSGKLDMLVGFFYFSGVKVMTEPLRSNKEIHLRVLVGMEAERFCGQIVEAASVSTATDNNSIRNSFYDSLRRVMGSDKVDNQAFHERLELFIELLLEHRLEIRKTLEPNHAKLYIFTMAEEFQTLCPKVWINGSSNFSEPGLALQNELNVEISDFGSEEASAYFEDLWEEAVPLTENEDQRGILIEILNDSSVAAAVTPFEAYFLIMKNYLEHQQSQLNEARLDRILKEAKFHKYRYQADAVAQAIAKLDQYHGVIIADVVGLGKSIIAGLLAAMRQKRGIIICPPGLMGSKKGDTGGWYEYKHKFKLANWEVWSRGDMEGLRKKLLHDPDFDMVIVDEAHNFRNERTCDYGCLSDVCFGKDVVLLTATPFNNRPSDLLALLHLFSNGRNSPFVPGGNLDECFKLFSKQYANAAQLNKAIARKDWKEIEKWLEKCGITVQATGGAYDIKQLRKAASEYGKEIAKGIRQVMEKIVIRRNRIDLMTDPDYAPEITTLSTVRPPIQQFFELTPEQDSFYDRVINNYFGPNGAFFGAVYRPQEYLKDKAGTDDYQNNIYTMMQRLLVMRFESSFGAFRQSLINARTMMTKAKEFIDRMGCYLYSRKAMEHIMEFPDDADAFEAMIQVIKELTATYSKSGKRGKRDKDLVYTMTDANFDDVRFKQDIVSDINLLGNIIEEVDRLELSTHDPKCEKLTSVIRNVLNNTHSDILAESSATKRKVLLFTAYGDTLRYIKGIVEKSFPGRVLAIDGENFSKENALKVKTNFDASFETQSDEYDILLATDKLSEGFNLNRAGIVINYDIPWNPTRVIQRVGRINRIGKKVFDNLYIFNFFPTVKGSVINQNREIAQNKMFAIHEILGEDARIFSVEEEPTAAALYSKLSCGMDDDETASFYSELKQKYAKARKFLQDNHPEELERIGRFPYMVKTASSGLPHATFMFRRQGPSFFAVVHDTAEKKISEWTLEDAIRAIECDYNTKRELFSSDFWSCRKDDSGKPQPGIYQQLKTYKTQGLKQWGGSSDVTQAVANIQAAIPQMTQLMKNFSLDIIEDLQSYGTLSQYTVKLLAKYQTKNKDDFDAILSILNEIRVLRGNHYLKAIKANALKDDVVVTVEKH